MKVVTTLCLVSLFALSTHAESPQTESVKTGSLQLNIPTTWKAEKTNSTMRLAQYSIPDGSAKADFVVFYFGGGATGGVKANVDRWVGQFEAKGLKKKMLQGKCAVGKYILVDTIGTWNKPDGPPFARKTIATPNSRALNVIVIGNKDGAEDYYFIKLSGDKEVVGKQIETLRKVIGADAKTEKPFDLKDAPN